jgi:hypothetical protein
MGAIDITLKLPKELVIEAQAAGILTDTHIAELIVADLERKKRVKTLFEDIEKLHALQPPISQEEIDAEMQAYRAEKAARRTPSDHQG